jgi:hypothetical protein
MNRNFSFFILLIATTTFGFAAQEPSETIQPAQKTALEKQIEALSPEEIETELIKCEEFRNALYDKGISCEKTLSLIGSIIAGQTIDVGIHFLLYNKMKNPFPTMRIIAGTQLFSSWVLRELFFDKKMTDDLMYYLFFRYSPTTIALYVYCTSLIMEKNFINCLECYETEDLPLCIKNEFIECQNSPASIREKKQQTSHFFHIISMFILKYSDKK